MSNRIVFYLFLLLTIFILPSWTYKFETCCSNEKTENTTASIRILSCPSNHIIKLRTVIFYTGNGCKPGACQRRLNKHYLACNNHQTCSISIKCIHMDSSICPWLNKTLSYSQHLMVDYDCILSEPEPPLIALNRLNNINNNNNNNNNRINQSTINDKQKVVLFSAKINIESPNDIINDSIPILPDITDDERQWKEFILKQYLNGKRPPLTNDEKPIIIQQQRSLFSDILRTVIILIVFTCILFILMAVGLFLYKRLKFLNKKKCFGHHKELQEKHEPFPGDEAYDNLKTSAVGSASDNGAATDV